LASNFHPSLEACAKVQRVSNASRSPGKRAGKHCTANKVSGHLPVWLCYQLLAPNGQNIVLQQIVQLARAKKKEQAKVGRNTL